MPLKILLADDSMTAQNMGKKILVDAGYEVIAVSNGAAAIKKIASERPDLAILDEYMPGYTGSEVCERVKASMETAKMPVLLTVGKMEAFDPEKAGKVRADGVMIKPFEATDLIAAVQSIAQRLLAPAPPPHGIDRTVQLRTPPGQTIEDTLKMTKPPAYVPTHEDTLRIPPPAPAQETYEETIRMTAQEIKAFQDASYHDWKANAEPHLEEHEKAEQAIAALRAEAQEEAPDNFVTPPIEEPGAKREEVAVSPAFGVPEPVAEPAAMLLDTPMEAPAAPVFAPSVVPAVISETPIFVSAPVVPVESEPAAPAFYTPTVEDVPAPAFAVQPEIAEAVVEPVMPTFEPEPEAATMTPALEAIVDAMSTPEQTAFAAPALETNAPLSSGPMPVVAASELEPASIPAIEVAAAPAHELEITSPPQERGADVAQDPELVTESEDISQFATKFGVEGAETVHVGVAAELPEEQLAAITMSQHPDEAAAETAQAVVTPSKEPGMAASPVEEQVGAIESSQIAGIEPMVAYVPDVADSQSFPAVREPEPSFAAPLAQVEPPAAEHLPPVVEVKASVVEPTGRFMQAEPPMVVELPAVEAVAETVSEPVSAVSVPEPAFAQPEVSPEHVAVVQAVETALAAAAGTVAAGIAPAVYEPASMPVHDSTAAEVERSEPYGDAALAEELAAALGNKPEDASVAEHAEGVAEPSSLAAAEHVSSVSDSKLGEAVARAFENLRPQLITEIIKQLSK